MPKTKRTKLILTLSIIVTVLIAVATWFAAVEKSWYIEGCADCIYQANVMRYRVFGETIHETTEEHNTTIRDLLSDLGVPCPHNAQFSHYKNKYYGLVWLVVKEDEETEILIGDDSWYTEEVAQKVRQLSKADPEFARQFYHQMIELQDYECWQSLFDKLDTIE